MGPEPVTVPGGATPAGPSRSPRRFVPMDELFAALAPAQPLTPEVLAALQAVDAEVEAMDDDDCDGLVL